MTEHNKFEEMLEHLVNEDREKAAELFHEIVVEKSRDIYESLLEDEDEAVEETTDEEVDEATDEEVDESSEDDLDEATDEEVEESNDEEVEEATSEDEVEEGIFDEPAVEADPADDMMGDIEMPGLDDEAPADDMGMGDDEEDGDIEDRVMDLEDELEALKAEFEAMMDDEAPGDEDGDEMPMDMDSEEGDDEKEEEAVAFEETDEEVEEATDEEVEESKNENKSQTEIMREYTDKVSASMGDNGANAKSPVAGANDMGGDASNIAKGGEESGMTPAKPKEDTAGNVNVPGGKAGKPMAAKAPAKGDDGANKKSTIGA